MSSSELLLRAQNLGKCYQLYEKPHHRLLQSLFRGKKQFYKEFWALQNISLELYRGESLGIVGRNGAGKSTLLQLLSRVLTPTTGTLEVHGRVAALLELGSGFNPEFTGRENAYLNGAILGLSKEEMDAAMPEIERFAGVGDFFDQPVKLYSSGMLVRVAFAVQVQIKPDVLIVDEALAVGDALFQRRCYQKMQELTNQGTSLLFVSHDTESVNLFTQKALLLQNGKCIESGSSKQVTLAYQRLLAEEQEAYTAETVNKFLSTTYTTADSNTTSFNLCGIKLHSVDVLNEFFEKKNVFYPKKIMHFDITFELPENLNNLFFSIRIVNKQGIKIYSWGTWNHDVYTYHSGKLEQLFINKLFQKDEQYTFRFTCICNLAPNFYEVQAGVTLADSIQSGGIQDLAWYHELAFFEVKPLQYYPFGGVCDMAMSVRLLSIL